MTLLHLRGAVIAAAAFAATSLALGAYSAHSEDKPAPKGPIVVANWGGLTNDAYQKFYIDPYTAETKTDVQQVAAPGLFVARSKAQFAANKIEWDILDSSSGPDTAYLASAGMIEPLPADMKARLVKQLGEQNVTDYGFRSGASAMLIVCHKKRVKVCPKNIKEFWDIKAFPEKRAIIGFNPIYPITQALLALGVPRDKASTAPIDVDAAFAKLKELRPAISVFWTTVDQGTQVLETGEADMGILYATRIYGELLPTGNYEVVWEDGVRAAGTTVVLKGAPHMDAAWHFMEWIATNLEAQAKFAWMSQKAPVDLKALELLDKDQQERFVNAPVHKGHLADPNDRDFNAKFDEINRRWQEFIAG